MALLVIIYKTPSQGTREGHPYYGRSGSCRQPTLEKRGGRPW
jgi:hypothetical protein